MCIYCGTQYYRKIYVKHHGSIPVDESGRKFDIHHIDGNRKNNEPDNLVALSIKDHYNIHYSQGDWGACMKISSRLNMSNEVISELSKRVQEKRINDGNHNFLEKDFYKNRELKKKVMGIKSNFTSEFCQQLALSRSKNGTHNFQGDSNPSRKKIKMGTHHFLEEMTCPHCSKVGKGPQMNRWHFNNCPTITGKKREPTYSRKNS
jgi:hypothetical protein